MKLVLISILLLAASCAHVNSVSQTSIPAQRNKVVTAQVEKNIFFFFNFNNDYIDQLTESLKQQCPNGSVRGILTKDVNITYFPIVYHKSVITAQGYCVTEEQQGKRNVSSKR